MTGAQLLLDGRESEVYALCRPSGHHAGPRVFGGYCYFNNVAAAVEILATAGPVAVLDIDYHHGNGNQEFFEERKDVFTCSIHGDPKREYPYFWGYSSERGVGQAVGTNLNLPLALGSGDAAYLKALDRALKAIRRFGPSALVVGAGFDTHADDPIGGFALTTDVYVGDRTASCADRLSRADLPGRRLQRRGPRRVRPPPAERLPGSPEGRVKDMWEAHPHGTGPVLSHLEPRVRSLPASSGGLSTSRVAASRPPPAPTSMR